MSTHNEHTILCFGGEIRKVALPVLYNCKNASSGTVPFTIRITLDRLSYG